MPPIDTAWGGGDAYEAFMGRWSSRVARAFLAWLDPEPCRAWLDVGCGTGALAEAIAENSRPREILGVDPAPGFVDYAAARVPGARFLVADAQSLPFDSGSFDLAVSGLVLNFIPDPARAASEIARVVRRDGVVAAYVWDYAGEMQFLRRFWEAAGKLDSRAARLDESRRFPLADRCALQDLLAAAGLEEVQGEALTIATVFESFDDFWIPFLGGQGPAPTYVASLSDGQRARLREALLARLPTSEDGTISLTARAWAARAIRR